MANTGRRTSIGFDTHRKAAVEAGGWSPKYNNGNHLHRQESTHFLPINFESAASLLAKMATTAIMLHREYSGSTVSAILGNMASLPRFAVSTHPQQTVELTKAPTWSLLFAFAVHKSDLLLLPDHAMGTWYESRRKRHVLDVVVCPSSLDEAVHLGNRSRQRAIYGVRYRYCRLPMRFWRVVNECTCH